MLKQNSSDVWRGHTMHLFVLMMQLVDQQMQTDNARRHIITANSKCSGFIYQLHLVLHLVAFPILRLYDNLGDVTLSHYHLNMILERGYIWIVDCSTNCIFSAYEKDKHQRLTWAHLVCSRATSPFNEQPSSSPGPWSSLHFLWCGWWQSSQSPLWVWGTNWAERQHNTQLQYWTETHVHKHLHVSLSLVWLTTKYQRETGEWSEN